MGKEKTEDVKEKNEKKEKVKKKVSKKKVIRLCIILLVVILIVVLAIVLIVKHTSKDETIIETDLDVRHMGITEEPTNWNENVDIYIDTFKDTDTGDEITYYVPIPEGFSVSTLEGETTVKEGLVIYEGEEEVTEESLTTRNQWVWVPVNPSNVYWTDSNGMNYGIYHSWSTSKTDIESGLTSSQDTREPKIQTGNVYYYEDYYLDNYKSYIDTYLDLYADMQIDFNDMVESIEKYGGFYIGRYELGGSVTNPTEVKGQTVLASTTWYKLYDACKNFETDENTYTSMIWGTLWDNTLMWLVESGDKTYSEIVDSRSWGNYSNSTGDAATDSGSKHVSGYNEAWKSENIYDLAGNVNDWTLEAYSSSDSDRYYRGGNYGYSGSSYPASYRSFYYPSTTSTYLRLQASPLYKVALNPEP